MFQQKSCVFLSTSPGPGGAASVLAQANNSAPYFGALVVGSLSVPKFFEHFDVEQQKLIEPQLLEQLTKLMRSW